MKLLGVVACVVCIGFIAARYHQKPIAHDDGQDDSRVWAYTSVGYYMGTHDFTSSELPEAVAALSQMRTNAAAGKSLQNLLARKHLKN